MAVLLITSAQNGSGKTMLGAGIGKHLVEQGKKVGFFKPMIGEQVEADNDALFMNNLLGLKESTEILSPKIKDDKNLSAKLKEAYGKAAQGKDTVIIEGNSNSGRIAEGIGAKVIVIEDYARESPGKEKYANFGKSLMGVVVNKVPHSRFERVFGELCKTFEKSKIKLLGVLPEDRTLAAISIEQLAEKIGGKILNNAEESGELIENLMLGAMVVDSGLDYYGRKTNKAAVIRSDRPDMQLAALATATRCLVVSRNAALPAAVTQTAARNRIPIVSAQASVAEIADSIEQAMIEDHFSQAKKLPHLEELLNKYFDFKTLGN